MILAAREDLLAVGRNRDRKRQLGVTFESLDLLARGGVPEADGVIEPGRRQALAVGAPCNRVDRTRVSLELADKSRLLG